MLLSRREFALGSLALPAIAAKKTGPDRPNVVLLLADNLPQWVIGVYGNKEIKTPNIDRFALTGTRFLDHISAAPAPGPGRASLMTGRSPMRSAGDDGLEKVLTAAGYTSNAADTTGALRLIDSAAPGKPFCLTVNLTSPRPPYQSVSEKHRALYAQTRFETFSPEPAAPEARAGKEMLADTNGSLRKYASAVAALDDEVQAVLDRIRQKRLVDQTLVILASTCGALLSHHGLWDAGEGSEPPNMYEEAVATPLIWSWPVRIPPQGVRPEIVSSYDLVPTLCEMLEIQPPAGVCGRSYALLATGKPLPKKQRWQTAVFGNLGPTWMSRGERYKLVVRDGGKGELYDLQTDHAEKTNQFENPQFETVKAVLSKELAGWRQKYS